MFLSPWKIVLVLAAGICWWICAPINAADSQGATSTQAKLIEDFDATWREGRWQFSNGPEFPGAKGSFERSKVAAHSGIFGGKLTFDFTGGGNYVAAILNLKDAADIKEVRLWINNATGNHITFRYTDATGQTLQKTSALSPTMGGAEIELRVLGVEWPLGWRQRRHRPRSTRADCVAG